MARKRSKAALRKRIKPASRWGGHLLLGLLIVALLSAAGMASQLLAASPSPAPPDSTATVSAASQAANVAGASSAAGASSSTRTLYVYGNQLRPLVEETNGVQTLNIYGPGGQIIAQVVQDGQGGQEVRYLLADHLGSTRVVLDADGNVVARFEYGPHGETTATGTAAAEVRYRYTGHPWDEAQGVYETPARGYDPTLGRFLSVDPQRADASPYVYAGNNPVGYVDPTGGGKVVPFVMKSGLSSSSRTRSIGDVLGMAPGQKILEATNVLGKPGTPPSDPPPESNIRTQWVGYHDKNYLAGREYQYNERLYWLIGDEKPLEIPGDIKRRAGILKRISEGKFGQDIVLIDISKDGTKHTDIKKALIDAQIKFSVARAGVTDDSWGGSSYARFIDLGGQRYDLDKGQGKIGFRNRIEEWSQKMPLTDQPGMLQPDIKGGAGPGNQLPETVPSLEHTTTSPNISGTTLGEVHPDFAGMDLRGVGIFNTLEPYEGAY